MLLFIIIFFYNKNIKIYLLINNFIFYIIIFIYQANKIMAKSEEQDIKVILVGEMGTGKTSLINVLMGGKFVEGAEITTSSASFVTKQMKIDNKLYSINLWDTIGQEKFRYLTKIFIKDSKIVIFVYDITRLKTFEELEFWFQTIKDVLGENVVLGIVGNKQDLFVKEEVKEEKVKKYAAEKKVPFKLTSAKNPLSFTTFLEELLKTYITKYGVVVHNNTGGTKLEASISREQKKDKGCC